MKIKKKNKGHVKESRQRRRSAHAEVKPQSEELPLIDGNYSRYVVAYCSRYKGYLTRGLAGTHDCQGHDCKRFRKVEA